jgi:cytochrome c oxidase assembly protein subunit 15
VPLTSWRARIRALPSPSLRQQRGIAIAAVVANVGIAVTGSIVRVTGSGLGCPTWPECVSGSMTPVEHPELSQLNQWIEYGNRLLAVVIGVIAALCLLSALRTRPRRRRVVLLSVTMFGGVAAQAVLGGITVLAGLLWWTVAIHLLVSPVLVWFAVMLLRAVGEGDQPPRPLTHRAVPRVLAALACTFAAVLVAGTLVTGAGPHAGDKEVDRLRLPVETLAHVHAAFLFVFLGLLLLLGYLLRTGPAESRAETRQTWRRYLVLLGVVLAQGLLGFVQFWTAVPGVLVVLHVLGAMSVTVALAMVWVATRDRGPVPGGEAPGAESRLATASVS